jgi:hypothetical protein
MRTQELTLGVPEGIYPVILGMQARDKMVVAGNIELTRVSLSSVELVTLMTLAISPPARLLCLEST